MLPLLRFPARAPPELIVRLKKSLTDDSPPSTTSTVYVTLFPLFLPEPVILACEASEQVAEVIVSVLKSVLVSR